MALEITTNIDLDFYDKKYILINAKQLDKGSRFLYVTCYDHGELKPLSEGEHVAYIRYKKPDGHAVFNKCGIDAKGKIKVNLTEQMLAVDGLCYADLVIVNKGAAEVTENGVIIGINGAFILSTMTFCIDTSETATLNSDIESTYEFNLLNKKLEEYWADYENVVLMSKSWAVGHTGIEERPDENTDNAKYYSEQARGFRNSAAENADAASKSAAAAGEYEGKALEYRNNAEIFKNNAETYAKTSQRYAVGGTGTEGEDEDNAKWYYEQTVDLEGKSSEHETNSANNAKLAQSYAIGGTDARENEDEDNAKYYYEQAERDYTTFVRDMDERLQAAFIYSNTANHSASLARSWAVGFGDEIREGSDTDNAKYYCELTKNIANGLEGGFIPMGTIEFAELANAEKVKGFTYNMKNDFVTDDTFKEGSGHSYAAGTNVYYTADGFWDCLGGSITPVASIDEVKDYLGIV